MIPLVFRRGLFLSTWAVVLTGIFMPQTDQGGFVAGLDKVVHVAALASMAVTLWLAFPRWRPGLYPLLLFPAALILEYLQPIVQPSRTFSYLDMGANLVGVAAGLVVCRWKWFRRWIPELRAPGG